MFTSMIPYLAALFAFISVILVTLSFAEARGAAQTKRSLSFIVSYGSPRITSNIRAIPDRSVQQWAKFIEFVGQRLVGEKRRAHISSELGKSGETGLAATNEVVTHKVIYLILGFAVGLLSGIVFGGIFWIALPLFTLGGFWLPDLLVYNRSLHRSEELGLWLPDALDMLNLCVESGLSFQAALKQVALNQKGPVAEEFALALQEIQYGRSRDEALIGISMRANQPDIQRFVSAMLQVDKLGIPITAVLNEQSRTIRAKRFDSAREQAQKMPVKILLPLMICFLPTLFIIILAPPVAQIANMFSGQ